MAEERALVIPASARWGEFRAFVTKELLSAIFALAIFASLLLSKVVHVPGLPRYDLVLVLCLIVQGALLASKTETLDELKMILLFHGLGFALEVLKVHYGSWAYPEQAYSKVIGVPLYSGFMYSSIGSYICQAFRRFELEIQGPPSRGLELALGASIYLNFFTNHFLPDLRFALMFAVFLLYSRTQVRFRCDHGRYCIPLTVSFLAIGFFVWVAENVCTGLQSYRYPDQMAG